MKRFLLVATVLAVLGGLLAGAALAAGPDGPSGKSNVGHVSLFQKNPANWSIVAGGAWGKYNYKLSGTGAATAVSGVFNGHGLVAGTDYSLIYYPEVAPNPWNPGGWTVAILGTGTADAYGDVHIAGTGTIGGPDAQPLVGDYIGQTGDKIWLVLSNCLTGSNITGWHPTQYLFEDNLINTP